MADSGIRQVLILSRIPRYPRKISTRDIKAYLDEMGYEASIRTIQRDLQALSLHHQLIDVPGEGRGNEGAGWAFAENAPVTITQMEPVAALALLLAGQHLADMLPHSVMSHLQPYVDQAENVLDGHDKRGFKRWPEKIRSLPKGMTLQPADVPVSVMDPLYEALLDNRKIRATYKGKEDRIIDPLGLVHRGTTIYLVCRFAEYKDLRITALHRFQSVEVLDQPVELSGDFSLDDYIRSGAFGWKVGSDKLITLKAKFLKAAGEHLYETPINDSQKLKPEGNHHLLLEARVFDTEELRRWLLGFGQDVEVLKPKSLRDEFRSWITSMVTLYDD